MAGLLAGCLVVAGVVVATPLNHLIQTRLDNPTSNEGRSNLGLQTMKSVFEGSPVVGFGTTRKVQGSFRSIAAGDSAMCPACSPPALGTQGHLWLVAFSEGLVGLAIYLAFFGLQFLRHIRMRSATVTAALSVLLTHAVTMPVYDTIGIALFPIMVAVGLLWRERMSGEMARAERDGRASGHRGPSLGTHFAMMRRHSIVVVVCLVAGLMVGGIWQLGRGSVASATVSVLLPEEPAYLTDDRSGTTLDTEAQIATDAGVLAAVSQAVGQPVTSSDIVVSATPNSRILDVRYTGVGRESVSRGATAAAKALLRLRAEELARQQTSALQTLRVRAHALGAALDTIDTSRDLLKAEAKKKSLTEEIPALRDRHNQMLAKAGLAGARIGRAESVPLDVGSIVRPAVARESSDGWLVSLLSGLMLGVIAAVVVCLAREWISPRVRRMPETGLPVLASVRQSDGLDLSSPTVDAIPVAECGAWDDAVLSVMAYDPIACIGAAPDALTCAVAENLERCLGRPSGTHRPPALAEPDAARPRRPLRRPRVVLVVRSRARTRTVTHMRRSVEATGSQVVGLVLVDG